MFCSPNTDLLSTYYVPSTVPSMLSNTGKYPALQNSQAVVKAGRLYADVLSGMRIIKQA